MIDTDKQQADCVSNGSIVVYVNGQKTETAEVEKVYGSFDDSNCTLKTSFRPGDRIRFEATAEDGQYQAGCEVEIPFPIEETIRVDTLRTQLRGGSSMMDCMRYKITIHDRPNEKNYYRLIIEENTYRIFFGNRYQIRSLFLLSRNYQPGGYCVDRWASYDCR